MVDVLRWRGEIFPAHEMPCSGFQEPTSVPEYGYCPDIGQEDGAGEVNMEYIICLPLFTNPHFCRWLN